MIGAAVVVACVLAAVFIRDGVRAWGTIGVLIALAMGAAVHINTTMHEACHEAVSVALTEPKGEARPAVSPIFGPMECPADQLSARLKYIEADPEVRRLKKRIEDVKRLQRELEQQNAPRMRT